VQIRQGIGVKAEKIYALVSDFMVYESKPWLLLNFRTCARHKLKTYCYVPAYADADD